MIQIKIDYQQEKIKKITITGHAEYEKKGKDIVCAAVSSIVITTVNGLLRINEKTIDYKQEEDLMQIIIVKNDEITDKLLVNLIELLFELQDQYPKNLEIRRCYDD